MTSAARLILSCLALFIVLAQNCIAQNHKDGLTLESLRSRLSSTSDGWKLQGAEEYPESNQTPWHRFFATVMNGYAFNFTQPGHKVKCSSGKGARADVEETPEFDLWVIPLTSAVTADQLRSKLQAVPMYIQQRLPSELGASSHVAAFILEGCSDIDKGELKRISHTLNLGKLGSQK